MSREASSFFEALKMPELSFLFKEALVPQFLFTARTFETAVMPCSVHCSYVRRLYRGAAGGTCGCPKAFAADRLTRFLIKLGERKQPFVAETTCKTFFMILLSECLDCKSTTSRESVLAPSTVHAVEKTAMQKPNEVDTGHEK